MPVAIGVHETVGHGGVERCVSAGASGIVPLEDASVSQRLFRRFSGQLTLEDRFVAVASRFSLDKLKARGRIESYTVARRDLSMLQSPRRTTAWLENVVF